MLYSMEGYFEKRKFDPNNREDLLAYKKFISAGGWGKNGCPFKLEQGFTSIPQMLTVKIANWAVKQSTKQFARGQVFFLFPALSFGYKYHMASYAILANNTNQTTPVLARGPVTITSEVNIYWRVGENPMADNRCALVRAGTTQTLRIPVKCSKLAVLAVDQPGWVTIAEVNGVKASCSS